MPMTDLDALSALAEAAKATSPYGWFVAKDYLDGSDMTVGEKADRAYIIALEPDVSLALIARVRKAEAALSVERIEDVIDAHVLYRGICRCGWGLKSADKRYARHLAAALLAALKGDSE